MKYIVEENDIILAFSPDAVVTEVNGENNITLENGNVFGGVDFTLMSIKDGIDLTHEQSLIIRTNYPFTFAELDNIDSYSIKEQPEIG